MLQTEIARVGWERTGRSDERKWSRSTKDYVKKASLWITSTVFIESLRAINVYKMLHWTPVYELIILIWIRSPFPFKIDTKLEKNIDWAK